MPLGRSLRPRCRRLLCGFAAAAVFAWAACGAAAEHDAPLDPLQRAVLDSLSFPRRTTAPELLDAAIRAAEVDAVDASLGYFGQFVDALENAGDGRLDLLADLGDGFGGAALSRLERTLRPREPGVGRVIGAIREASSLRRRDPRRLAEAAAALGSESARERLAAAERLSKARTDAIPAVVDVLQSAAEGSPARTLARGLLRDLGPEARQPLLEWLASDDVEHWPGIIEALEASGADDIDSFLLAPALVADSPAPARAAAVRLLQTRAARRVAVAPEPVPPSPDEAIARLARRLDRTLMPAGLPEVDHLLLEPVTDAKNAAAAFGGAVTGTVERFVWNPQARLLERMNLSPRAARLQEAMHITRDLIALAPEDPAAIRLALLAQLESAVVLAGEPATAVDRIDPKQLREAVSPPEGFSAETAAEVLELAVTHGMWEAAAAAAATLELAADDGPQGPLPASTRKSVVRALAVPDAGVQFAAAKALALAAGEPPYPGSSRVIDILLHAATSTGIDRAIVAHPHLEVAQALATDVSRFGYQPTVVSTGREAIFAARNSADTALVILGARTVAPGPLETVQFLQQQGLGDAPPVLIVVDPLDDDGRGCFLQQLIVKFCDMHGIAIVDRLDSFFEPALDGATGEAVAPPRFPDAVAQAAGPQAVDPASRETRAAARLERARTALAILGRLGRRGWDVSAAVRTARSALLHPDLHEPALSLLSTIGRAEAQQALEQEAERLDIPEASRRVALASFEASVARYGLLLKNGEMLAVARRYNRAADAESRDSAAAILDVIEPPIRPHRAPPVDAAPARPTR